MAEKTLSRDEVALGRAVLLVTDGLGMAAEGAFWLYDSEDHEWRYFLVTSLFDHIDTHAIYLRLVESLKRKLSEQESGSIMIYLCGPGDRLAKLIREKATTNAHVSEPIETTIDINGRTEKACVYRMATKLPIRKRNLARTRFGQRYKELTAA